MAGQNDRGRNRGIHDQGRPHCGTVVLQAIEVDLDSDIGLAFVLCARTPEGLLSDSEVPDKHGLTAEAWSSDRFVITSISEANDKPLPPIKPIPSRESLDVDQD
jgi:hypothetical protein